MISSGTLQSKFFFKSWTGSYIYQGIIFLFTYCCCPLGFLKSSKSLFPKKKLLSKNKLIIQLICTGQIVSNDIVLYQLSNLKVKCWAISKIFKSKIQSLIFFFLVNKARALLLFTYVFHWYKSQANAAFFCLSYY